MPVDQTIVNQVAALVTHDPELFVGDRGVETIPDTPAPTPRMGNDPLASAISKIKCGFQEGAAKFGFPHPQAIQSSFGLDNEEFANVRHRNLIERAPEKGWGFNMRLFENLLRQFSNRGAIQQSAPPPAASPTTPITVMTDFDNLLTEANVGPKKYNIECRSKTRGHFIIPGLIREEALAKLKELKEDADIVAAKAHRSLSPPKR